MEIAVKYKLGEKVAAGVSDGLKAIRLLKSGVVKSGKFRIDGDEITLIFETDHDTYKYIKSLGIRVFIVKHAE